MKKKGLLHIWLAAVWCVCLLAVLGGVTYAWFTFDPFTRVEPMSGSIGPGEATLLIAANPRDEFGKQCLLPQYNGQGLKPVSTIDLTHFYRAYSQSRQGISLAFQDVSHLVEEDTIHGTLYLQSLSEACDVYFYLQGMDFGNDPQMLAALRLGLRFTTEGGVRSYIFELNEAGNTEGAVAMQTTAQNGVVVAGIREGDVPVYEKDPARSINAYASIVNGEQPMKPDKGEQALCTLAFKEIAKVEYWLYLEGCDENCVNEVQNRDVMLQLAFAGVTHKQEE